MLCDGVVILALDELVKAEHGLAKLSSFVEIGLTVAGKRMQELPYVQEAGIQASLSRAQRGP